MLLSREVQLSSKCPHVLPQGCLPKSSSPGRRRWDEGLAANSVVPEQLPCEAGGAGTHAPQELSGCLGTSQRRPCRGSAGASRAGAALSPGAAAEGLVSAQTSTRGRAFPRARSKAMLRGESGARCAVLAQEGSPAGPAACSHQPSETCCHLRFSFLF